MSDISIILNDYSDFLKEYNAKIKQSDVETYKKNLKLISSLNKLNPNKNIVPNTKDKSHLNHEYYYKNIQKKVKSGLNYTFKKMLETDKFNDVILKDSNSFFTVVSALTYSHIVSGKQYLDMTKYL